MCVELQCMSVSSNATSQVSITPRVPGLVAKDTLTAHTSLHSESSPDWRLWMVPQGLPIGLRTLVGLLEVLLGWDVPLNRVVCNETPISLYKVRLQMALWVW